MKPARAAAILAFLVALAASWVPGFWYDEAASIAAAHRPLAAMPRLLARVDLVHSQFYFLLHLWCSVFGWGQFSARVPSAIASAVTLWCVWRVAATWSTRRAAWVASVLAIAIPGIAWSTQQARPFALAAMWLMLATWLVVRGSAWPWVALVAALAVWAEIYTVLALPGLLLIAWQHRRIRGALLTLAAVVVAALPFGYAVSRQKGQLGGHPGFTLINLPGTVLHASYFVGPHDGDTGVPLTGPGSYLAMVAVLGLGLLACWDRANRRAVAGLWVAALLPPVAMFVVAMPSGSLYSTRYFAFTVPFLALAAGLGSTRLAGSVAGVVTAAAVLGCVPLLIAMRLPYGHAGQDYAAVAAAVHRAHPDAVVYDAARARATQVAYPGDFAGVRDLTTTTGDSASLFGGYRAVTAASLRDTHPTRLMLIAWQPGKAAEQELNSTILAAGCVRLDRQVIAKVALTSYRCG